VIVARPTTDEGPPQRREGEVFRIDERWRGDPTMTGPPLLDNEGVSSERQESTTMKEPIRFSTAFCMWLLIGGPLL
jgi:hypothetical protein